MVIRAITIRFPDNVASDAQAESATSGESINQLVVEAVTEALERRRAKRALERTSRRLSSMRADGRIGRPSETLIRDLREDRHRRG